MEITTLIFKKKDEDEKTYILDKILDKTGMKGTGEQKGCYLTPVLCHGHCEGHKLLQLVPIDQHKRQGRAAGLPCMFWCAHAHECTRQGHTSCSDFSEVGCPPADAP